MRMAFSGNEKPLNSMFRIKEVRVSGDSVEFEYRHPIDGSIYFTLNDENVSQVLYIKKVLFQKLIN